MVISIALVFTFSNLVLAADDDPFLPITQNTDANPESNTNTNTEQTNTEQISLQSKKEMMTEEFKNRIDYEVLSDTYGSELLDCICKTVTETLCGGKKTVRINGSDIPLADVSERYSQLNSENLSFAIDTVAENKNGIKNPVSYWASVLYNAPVDEKLWVESEFNKYRKETGI